MFLGIVPEEFENGAFACTDEEFEKCNCDSDCSAREMIDGGIGKVSVKCHPRASVFGEHGSPVQGEFRCSGNTVSSD